MEPAQTYRDRLARWRDKDQLYDRQHRRLGGLRILFAVVLVALALFVGRMFPTTIGMVIALLVVGLFLSGKWHDRVLTLRDTARRAIRFYESGLDRLGDNWTGKGSPGTEFLDPHHPYAIDLDIFGRGSIFELLNVAQTQGGRATLAQWLLHRAGVDEIRARQLAVADLRQRLDLREDLGLLAGDEKGHIQTSALIAWTDRRGAPVSGAVRIAAFCLPILTWSLLALGLFPLFSVALAVQTGFGGFYRNRVKDVFDSLTVPSRDINWLARIFKRLEQEKFQAGPLQELQTGWHCEGSAASDHLLRLTHNLEWADSHQNFFVSLLSPLFLLKTQFAFALEARRLTFGHKVKDWLADLGKMEALSSMGNYAFERPEDPFPEVLPESSPLRIEAEGLGHPLIPDTRSVRNDIVMNSDRRLFVVSGSNMSGKSTWLRALGANMVLGMAGAPVRAQRMVLTPLPVGASIRATDSLNEGISRFYAEIKRLRQLIELTEQNERLLFLVDELLNGTNSHDRRIGAASVVKALLVRGAIGLVTTHDLALTQIVNEVKPPGENCHFEDQFVNGQMSFDYRLRPGVVEKSNALALMRSIGLEV